MTSGAGQPWDSASASHTGTPNTWSMWPWEYTAVLSRAVVQVRMSSWTTLARGALPVSTRTRPSPVAKDETLAKEGQKPTPSVISTKPPMWSTGWKVDVEISPFHKRSATERTSGGTAANL